MEKCICSCRLSQNSSFSIINSSILWSNILYIWIWNTLKCFVCLLSDLWRPSSSTSDGLRNGDLCSSSLAAKGYRSVRPTFQDKKSPTPVRSAVFTSLICFSHPYCCWRFSFLRKCLWKPIWQVLFMTFLTVPVTPISSVWKLSTKQSSQLLLKHTLYWLS